jgi:hypothetical protein
MDSIDHACYDAKKIAELGDVLVYSVANDSRIPNIPVIVP